MTWLLGCGLYEVDEGDPCSLLVARVGTEGHKKYQQVRWYKTEKEIEREGRFVQTLSLDLRPIDHSSHRSAH